MLVQIFVRNKLLAALIALLLSSAASAQDGAAAKGSKVGKDGKTIYMEFGNELIDGTGSMPSVEMMMARKQFNFKRLIRLRENFQQEVREGKGDFGASK